MTPALAIRQRQPNAASNNNRLIVVEDLWIEAYETLAKTEKTRNLVRKYEDILMKLYVKDLNGTCGP